MLAGAFVCAFALALSLGGIEAGAQETTTETPEPGSAVGETPAPEIGSGAWTLMDIRTGEFLAGEKDGERLPMASTTKIMLALVALESADLDEEVIISEEAASFAVPLYSNVGLFPGDALSVRELLMASMISSGDDAAYALAEHLGGGSVEQFVEEMNRKAEELGLGNTRFENPVGLDDKGHYSSARDLAKMARRAFQYPVFREIVSTSETTISTQDRVIPLANTNELLYAYTSATGVKTGTTPAAGPSLVASAASGDEAYITVVLDDEQRFEDAAAMLDYGFAAYDRRVLISEDEKYSEVDVPYRQDEKIDLVAAEAVVGLVDENPGVERRVEMKEDLPPSANPGTRLGKVVVSVDGERVGESALVARQGYEEAPPWQKLWYTVQGILE
ncbi:MAG: D-alanyl-D-alanine carboxypeptidase family protein [Rubrobacteraceae bacterium]